MWTKQQGVEAANYALGSYTQQVAELEAEKQTVDATAEVARSSYHEALKRAAAAILPSATPEDLASAARETGGSHLVHRRAEYEQNRDAWAQRLAAIEADPNFVNRDAMLSPHGTIVTERNQCAQNIAQYQAHLGKFSIEPFQWLQNREVQRQLGKGAFSSFMDTVTLGGHREKKARKQCVAALGYPDWDQLIGDYNNTHAHAGQLQERINQLDAFTEQLNALIAEHSELYQWVHNFEHRLAEGLRDELADHMSKSNLRQIHRHVRPGARKLVAIAFAMASKGGYLLGMKNYLDGQIADRNRRMGSISNVRSKWAVKPHDRLHGDKHKWLVALPDMKRDGTQKRARLLRRMHRNVCDYDDWDDFDYYLYHDDHFFPYDAFGYGADEPMPYEGFSREVLPELDQHRASHGQEKADYSAFRELDKQGGGSDREAHADEQQQQQQDTAEAAAAAAAIGAVDAMEMTDAS